MVALSHDGSHDGNGTRRIQFIGVDGRRRAIRSAMVRNEPYLGTDGLRNAETCCSLRDHAICTVAEAGLEPARSFRNPGF